MRSSFRVVAGLALSQLLTCGVLGAEPAWSTAPYDYVIVDQDLRSVLQQFGANTGLRLTLSDKVQGRVRGPLPSVPPREFFNNLTRQFGLDWTYDGSIISVSSTSEAQTQLLPLQGVGFDKLHKSLTDAGLLDLRFELRSPLGGDIVLISGPPRYLAIVQQVLAALAAEKTPLQRPAAQKALVLMRGSASTRVEFP